MNRKISSIVLVLLFLVTIIESVINSNLEKKILRDKVIYEKSKSEINNLINKYEAENKRINSYGYGDVLDLLSKNLKLKITNIKKEDSVKGNIIVQIEFISEESEIEGIVSQIYNMDNLQYIRKFNIRGNDLINKYVILDGVFKVK